MKTVSAALLALTSAYALSACTTAVPIRQPMPAAAREKLAVTEVVVPIRQNEIYIVVPQSNTALILASAIPGVGVLGAAMLGGLAGAVDAGIHSGNMGAAEKALLPLRDALVEFDFDHSLQAELVMALSPSTWLNARDFRIVKEVSDENFDGILSSSKASAVLFVSADYHLTANADALKISLAPYMFPNAAELKTLHASAEASGPKTSAANSMYRSMLSYRDRAPDITTDRNSNLAVWASDDGAALRASMKHGMRKLAEMLADDIQLAGISDADHTKTQPTIKVDGLDARVIASDKVGSLVMMPAGELMYLTKAALADPPKARPRPKVSKEAPSFY